MGSEEPGSAGLIYLQARVMNGYLIPVHPNTNQSNVLHTYHEACMAGDETALDIMSRVVPTKEELDLLLRRIGLFAVISTHRFTLYEGCYPAQLAASPDALINHLHKLSDEGHFCAQRIVSYIARQKLNNGEYTIGEAQRHLSNNQRD